MDTSAWVEFFRAPRSPWGQAVDLLVGEGRVCTTPLVIVEVVSGARDRAMFDRLHTDFLALPRVDPPPTLWDEMPEVRWRLKRAGVAGVSIPDLIVAMTAQAAQKTILTCDRDFRRMQPVLNLQLLDVSE